jgi:hypothetical protein
VTDEQLSLVRGLAADMRAEAEDHRRETGEPVLASFGEVDALEAVIAAAAKPPVVVGLTEEEREAICVARATMFLVGGDKETAMRLAVVIDDMLTRAPNEYAAVRREDWQSLYDTLCRRQSSVPSAITADIQAMHDRYFAPPPRRNHERRT